MAVFVAVSVIKQNKKQFASSQTEISFIKKKTKNQKGMLLLPGLVCKLSQF